MGAAFDRDGLMDDVAFDLSRRSEAHFQPAHAALYMAVDDDVVGDDFAGDRRGLANRQKMGADVAFNRAFDLNVA